MTDVFQGVKRDRRSDPSRSGLYVLHDPAADRYKIGVGDIAARVGAAKTHAPTAVLFAAIVHPNHGTLETRLHGFFDAERVGKSEWFVASDRLMEWLTRFRQAWPAVVTSLDDLGLSHAADDVWPWSLPPEQYGQLDLGISLGPYVSPTGSGIGQLSSRSEDWYTHPSIVARARRVLGDIDLDPMSCPEANIEVRAHHIFTAETDGMRWPWKGRVFLNPPWGKGPKREAVAKLIAHYDAGDVDAAIVVLNANATTSHWFAPLFRFTILFTYGRPPHYGPGGIGGAPNSGTVVVYLGPEPERFAEVFADMGNVVQSIATYTGAERFAEASDDED